MKKIRITESLLKKYHKLDIKERAIREQREAIRQAILADGRDEIAIGTMVASVCESQRMQAISRDEIIAEIGAKACDRIMRKVKFSKVSVKKKLA